jgi:hypothetical protein
VFSGPSGQALSSGVVGFQDDEAARSAYDSTANTAAKCRQPLEAAMTQALKADFEKEPELAGVPVEFDVAFADLPLQPPGGDSSNAYRFYIDIHLPGETRELTIDVLMTRVRRFVGVFSHFAPAGSDITQDLAYRFVGKLTGATAQVRRQPSGRSPELQ